MEDRDTKRWNEFLAIGKRLFQKMIQTYDTMMEGDTVVKHFHIRTAGYRAQNPDIIDALYEAHGEAIQKELVPWIRKENANHMLFSPVNWKPVQDFYEYHWMYMGYRKVFRYQQFYFQLVLDDDICDEECSFCHGTEWKRHTCFQLALLGWKDDTDENMMPYKELAIPSNNLIPYSLWKRK